jgi:L-threonylcarbamoyladenylate synthase
MSFPTEADIARAAVLIRAGKLVAFPTETVYGLGANALDPAAVARIYEAKGRPADSPLIVHVDSIAMARTLAKRWPGQAQQLAERWWPGPLTLVVEKHASVPDIVTAGLPTVGLRMPDHPVALSLLRAAGTPIAAPSANRFSELSPTTADHVEHGLSGRVDMILDGGPCRVGIESTVISLADNQPRLLRPGGIGLADIESVIGPVALASGTPGGAHPAPGMHPRHYSPRTPLYLLPIEATPPGRGAYLRWPDMPAEPAVYASQLYQTLHRLDQEGWDWLAVELPPDTPEWAAVRDRLRRAATPLDACQHGSP